MSRTSTAQHSEAMTFTDIATATVVVLGMLLMAAMAVVPTLVRRDAQEPVADVIHLDDHRPRTRSHARAA